MCKISDVSETDDINNVLAGGGCQNTIWGATPVDYQHQSVLLAIITPGVKTLSSSSLCSGRKSVTKNYKEHHHHHCNNISEYGEEVE